MPLPTATLVPRRSALHMAIKSHGIVGFTEGAVEASNGHYRILITDWTPEERRIAVQWLNGEHAS